MVAPARWPSRVTIVEVGPRDGLQNEATPIPTELKVQFVEALAAAGLPIVETTSFVHPKVVPQLADAAEVLRSLQRRPGTRYPVLVPNQKGLERALAAGAEEIAVFTAASEAFNRANIAMGIEESLGVIAEVLRAARTAGLRRRGYISTCFGCPYQGAVPVETVVEVSRRLLELGAEEVSLGDTIGVANPRQVQEVVGRVLEVVPRERLALHFHDTRGVALANVLAALELGITTFDASAGGLGGCPYAPGAAGNLATEDLVTMLDGMGIRSGVSLGAVVAAVQPVLRALGRPSASKAHQAYLATQARQRAASGAG